MGPLFVEQDDIFEACRVGALAKVKMFVEVKNTTLDCRDEDRRTPLHWASASGHAAIVAYLLEKGATGDTVDDDGTCLCANDSTTPNVVPLQDGRHS